MPQVLIIEDHQVVARSVAMIVEDNFPDSKVSLAVTFREGLDLLHTGFKADLIILDIDIPGGESSGMIARFRDVQPEVKILVFTGQLEEKHALEFLTAGANGFLSKNSPFEQIGVAIRRVISGKKYMTEQVQQQVTDRFFNKVGSIEPEPMSLSPRETEVLNLLMEGKWVKEIANELNLKLTTVSTHKTRIFEKMQVTNIIELYKKARLG